MYVSTTRKTEKFCSASGNYCRTYKAEVGMHTGLCIYCLVLLTITIQTMKWMETHFWNWQRECSRVWFQKVAPEQNLLKSTKIFW